MQSHFITFKGFSFLIFTHCSIPSKHYFFSPRINCRDSSRVVFFFLNPQKSNIFQNSSQVLKMFAECVVLLFLHCGKCTAIKGGCSSSVIPANNRCPLSSNNTNLTTRVLVNPPASCRDAQRGTSETRAAD